MGSVESQPADRTRCSNGTSHHILCYGDNLTLGFCANGRQSKPYAAALSDALACAGLKCKVSVGGLSGHTARQMVASVNAPTVTDARGRFIGRGLRSILEKDGPFDLCIIMAGTNDLTLLSQSENIISLGECKPTQQLDTVLTFGTSSSGAVREPFGTPFRVLRDLRSLHECCHKHGVPTVALAPLSHQRQARQDFAKLLAEWVQTAQQVLAYADANELVSRSVHDFWEPDNVHLSPAGSAVFGQRIMAHLLPVISYLGGGEAAMDAAVDHALRQERRKVMQGKTDRRRGQGGA